MSAGTGVGSVVPPGVDAESVPRRIGKVIINTYNIAIPLVPQEPYPQDKYQDQALIVNDSRCPTLRCSSKMTVEGTAQPRQRGADS